MQVPFIQEIHTSGIHIASFLVCFSVLIYTLIEHRLERFQNKVFFLAVIAVMLDALCEIGQIILTPLVGQHPWVLNIMSLFQYIYFMSHMPLSMLLYVYMRYATGALARHKTYQEWGHPLHIIPLLTAELFILLNPLFHWVYVFSDKGELIRLWGGYLVYACAGVYLIMVFSTLMTNWRGISVRRRYSLVFFFLILVAGVTIQITFPQIKAELFSEALALLGLMITIENEDDRLDTATGVSNRSALLSDLNMFIRQGMHFHLVGLRITNVDVLQRLIGETDSGSLIAMVGRYLMQIHVRYYIYRTTPASFILVVHGGEEKAMDLANTIDDRFSQVFKTKDAELLLQALLMVAEVPGNFRNAEDVMLMSDSPVPVMDKRKILRGHDLDFLIRRAEVESALHRGFNEHNFDIYYQPIYRMEGMSIYSAEALLRLKDSRIGNITPDEFIPVAEQNGMIDQLGEYVLEEVCIFLSSGIPAEMGLECISINLSVLQCMQPDFVERTLAIIQKYNVSPGQINLEITETAATSDYRNLASVIKQMRNAGFIFSLDKYGVGYSNMKSVFDLDFNVIKIDKTILWDAERGENGRIILENSIRMIQQMDLAIIAEGVETQKHIELLEGLGVDYLQGYYFSQPVSKNELLGILRVTELARMEEQRAHAASEAKTGFLTNMSHEIRTPINAVLGMDEMILRESHDPRILEYARNIEGAGRTLLSLINDILDFSKIESGSMTIDEKEYGLSSVINDVINMVKIKAEQKGLEFNVHVDSSLPDRLLGDEMRNRQIMVNILNNAIKYTQEGSVSLDVAGEIQRNDRILLSIAISDTGMGIRQEDMGKLFKKFQRLDEVQNQKIEGSGLGLAITYNLLQIMKGSIDVQSTYGAGSTFTVSLPQRIVSHEAIGDFRRKYHMSSASREVYRESFRAPSAQLLVVDDMAVNHTVVKELLKRTGVNIDTALSGKECLEKVQAKEYDLILLDFRMPEMDGIETLNILRTLPGMKTGKLPVIALTADAVTGARERFIHAGFDDYLMKPVDGRKLEEMLIQYLPEEKVYVVHGDEELSGIEEEEEPAEEEAPEWLSRLGDLNTDTGIANCGSADGYKSVLQIYYENISPKADEIRAYYEKEDWENYTILVHALKSSSRIIGAAELSSWAEELEAAGNALELDKIRNNTDRLLERYRGYGDILKEIFGDAPGAEEEEDESGLEEIAPSMYADALSTMKDFAKMFDYDNILFVIDSLKDYRLPEGKRSKLSAIRREVENLNWEEVGNILKEM